MPYIVKKNKPILVFIPFNQYPDVKFNYFKVTEAEFREIREKHGKLVYNQGSKVPDFVVTDEEGFKQVIFDKIIHSWEGFVDGETGLPITKDQKELIYSVLTETPWMMNALINRALGLTGEADLENFLVQKKAEDAGKNS